MKELDQSIMLKLLDSLRNMSAESDKAKLPKKGISITKISVAKPKSLGLEEPEMEGEEAPMLDTPPETASEVSEEPEMEGEEELSEEPQVADAEAEEEQEEMEGEEEPMLAEPKIPSDVMELVKMMLAMKAKKKDEDELS